MRLSSALQTFFLLLGALLLVASQAIDLEDVQAASQAAAYTASQDTAVNSNKGGETPKLFKPRTGIMKEEHDVDPGNQRARADEMIEENADDDERVIDSLEDLS